MEDTQTEQNTQAQEKTFPASVVAVLDGTKLAINRGSAHGLRMGQRMVVYSLSSEEIIDPVSGESLGLLEIFKGTGKIVHLQDKMANLESDREKSSRTIFKPAPLGFSPLQQEIVEHDTEKVPFDNPREGDRVKPI